MTDLTICPREDCTATERHWHTHTGFQAATSSHARAEVERLTAVVRRVRELHRESRGSMSALYPNLICECGKDYPCPTIRALDATPETGGES